MKTAKPTTSTSSNLPHSFAEWLHDPAAIPIDDVECFSYVGWQEGIFHIPGYHLWNELTTGSTFTTTERSFVEANARARQVRLAHEG